MPRPSRVPAAFASLVTLILVGSMAAAGSSHQEQATAADEAVVEPFLTWWADNTCSYEPDADCTTAKAVRDAIGIAALGVSAASWPAEDRSVASWILAHPEDWDDVTAVGPGPSLAMTILALEGAGVDPRAVPADGTERDLVADVAGHMGPDGYGSPVADAWVLFAFKLVRLTNDTAVDTVGALAAAQGDDGGWSWAAGQDPDPDTTAWAVTALAPHVRQRASIEDGLGYLRAQQIQEGEHAACWPGVGGAASAASTSVALGALNAAGESQEAWRAGGQTPFECFLSFQQEDGSFETAFAAYQTARALGGVPLGWPTAVHDDGGSSPDITFAVVVVAVVVGAVMRRRV